jgi:hypothetical protein
MVIVISKYQSTKGSEFIVTYKGITQLSSSSPSFKVQSIHGLLRIRISTSELMNLFEHLVGRLGCGYSPMRGLYPHRTTQQRKTRTHIHAPSGIRARDPSVRMVEDSMCLRLRGHWYRQHGYHPGNNHSVQLISLIKKHSS